jgi:hypothetical protein
MEQRLSHKESLARRFSSGQAREGVAQSPLATRAQGFQDPSLCPQKFQTVKDISSIPLRNGISKGERAMSNLSFTHLRLIRSAFANVKAKHGPDKARQVLIDCGVASGMIHECPDENVVQILTALEKAVKEPRADKPETLAANQDDEFNGETPKASAFRVDETGDIAKDIDARAVWDKFNRRGDQ